MRGAGFLRYAICLAMGHQFEPVEAVVDENGERTGAILYRCVRCGKLKQFGW